MRYENAVQLWQGWNIRSASDLDKYLDSFRILFAYHSGRIENADITYNDTREIFQNGRVSSYTGDPRALFEQQNQKLCYEVLKEKFEKKRSSFTAADPGASPYPYQRHLRWAEISGERGAPRRIQKA